MKRICYSYILIVLLALGDGDLARAQLKETTKEIPGFNKDANALKYAATITETDLRNYLEILASDALEGRETGTRGQKMAAAFIQQHFVENKLKPVVPATTGNAYQQQFTLYRNYYRDVYLAQGQNKYQHMKDLLFYGDINIPSPVQAQLRFVGQGEVEDYVGLEVKGQLVVFYANNRSERSRKMKIAREHEAMGYLVIIRNNQEAFLEYLQEHGHYFQQTSISEAPSSAGDNLMFLVYPELVAQLLSVSTEKLTAVSEKSSGSTKNPLQKVKPAPITLMAERYAEAFTTENILGFVEGSDLKDEVIVLTAHYDHEGKRGVEVYNGADDDGSGTVAIMELAQAFAQAKAEGNGPRRSLLFMTVTAEEKGLLGSDFYVKNPVFPLQNTVANLNVDMIGRTDDAHQPHEPYVYVIGSDRLSRELHDINEQMNLIYTQLQLDYKYNDKNDPNRFYYRSDHYNFARHNIPIIFYFNGTHEDYHRSTDTVEKIDFTMLKKRTELVFFTAWELANRRQRIRLNGSGN